MNKVRFLHFRLFLDGKSTCEPRGGITVAYEEIEDNIYNVSVSFCSVDPSEQNYNRKVGASYAMERMRNGEFCTIAIDNNPVLGKRETFLSALYAVINMAPGYQRWARNVRHTYNTSHIMIHPQPHIHLGALLCYA